MLVAIEAVFDSTHWAITLHQRLAEVLSEWADRATAARLTVVTSLANETVTKVGSV